VSWLSLNDFSGSPSELVKYLIAAMQQPVRSFGTSTLPNAAPPHNLSLSDTAADFCNEVVLIGAPIFLFLDDFHTIAGTEAAKLITLILNEGPSSLHFIIGTRSDPRLPLGRLRALGRITRFDINDLRFSNLEAQEFFALSRSGVPVPLDMAKLAVNKTEGWPAGLQLLSLSMSKTSDPTALLASFSGTHRDVVNYLAEDVLNRLPLPLQDFLLCTSILGRFCADLCDAVIGRNDSRVCLDQLEGLGMFIFSLDNEGQWYRYHHLFSAFLSKNLSDRPAAFRAMLHQRACTWFTQNGLTEEAFHHAIIAGEIDHAAALLEQAWYDLYLRGDYWTLRRWAAQLPESVLARYPKIQLERAWMLILEWRFDEANKLIKSVSEQMQHDGTDAPPAPLVDEYSLPHLLKHREMMIAQFADDMPTVERLCNELLSDFPYCDAYLEGTLYISLLYAQREQYRLGDVERLNAKTRACFQRARAEAGKVWQECILGPTYFLQANLDAAAAAYRRAIEIACRGCIGTEEVPLVLVPSLLLSDVLIERFQLAEAHLLLERFLPLAQRQGFVDSLIAGYVGRARLAHIEQDWATADKTLSEGFEFALAHSFDRLKWNIVSERVKQSLLRDNVAGAVREANNAGLPKLAAQVIPSASMTTTHETIAVTWVRVALATGDYTEALRVLRQWVAFATHRNCVRTQVRMQILLARAFCLSGDNGAALRSIKQALDVGARAGMIYSFVEECEPIKSLIMKTLHLADDVSDLQEYGQYLIAAFSAQYAEPIRWNQTTAAASDMKRPQYDSLVEPLTTRETDILKFVDQGMLNKEIADRLGMTEGSVKWYLQQIYGKLGVRRRHLAIQKARAIGYLH
jgi:LuxR family maltose regulon positive regulatory protein